MASPRPESMMASFAALDSDPTVTVTSVGTTPVLGCPDAAVTTLGERIIRICNQSAANTLGFFLVAAGATPTPSRTMSLTAVSTEATPILPEREITIKIKSSQRLCLVASAASTLAYVSVTEIPGV